MVTMRPPVLVSIIVLALALIVASFNGGRVAERRAQQQSSVRVQRNATATANVSKSNRLLANASDENSHVLIANVASVSFGELWDVMRAAAPERRGAWAHELEQMSPGTRRNAAIKSFFKIWVELDPTAAIEDVEKISDKRMRGMAFAALADAAADSALPAIA